MDDLLAKERAAQEYVKSLQSHAELPFQVTLDAFTAYRSVVQDVVLGDIVGAERFERRLWDQHVETRQLLARTLRELRRKQEQKITEIKVATEMYLRFVKHSARFYRKYIHTLHTSFGGIAQLRSIAQQLKQDEAMEISEAHRPSQDVQDSVLRSCYRTLIYLGDLCRYRASDNLDKQQDFGPALGYYGLACVLIPQSGWGHNQQALVALETKQYLLATYHLYKSFLVAEPLALGKRSLLLHFERTNAAWDKGELIQKNGPGDPSAGKHAIVGLFVRLHSVCVTGEQYRGYTELERELLSRLTSELRTTPLKKTLCHMVLVNIGAQHFAMDNYRERQSAQNEQAFYYFLRINIVFFTALLELFQADLLDIAKDPSMVEADLPDKLKDVTLRVLPGLRLYSAWLLLNSHLLTGLSTNDFLAAAIQSFWTAFAHTLDLVATCFPVFDLEDAEEVFYMLEEDVEAQAYLPIDDIHAPKLVRRMFVRDDLVTPKSSFANIDQVSDADEALSRILGVLEAGSHNATTIEESPIFIRGTRFVLGSIDAAPFDIPRPPKPEPPKPLSYAAAAAQTSAKAKSKPRQADLALPAISAVNASSTSNSPDSRISQDDAHLTRMVDSLVEDDEVDQPVTPPQPWASSPAVVPSHGDSFEMPHLTQDSKIAVEVNHAAGKPVTQNQRSSGKKAHQNQDMSDFLPRPRTTSGQLWSPASPQLAPSAMSRMSPRQNLNAVSRSPNQRAGSNKHILTQAENQDINSPNARTSSAAPDLPTSSNASPERPHISPAKRISAHVGSPLLFGGESIWNAVPNSPSGNAD